MEALETLDVIECRPSPKPETDLAEVPLSKREISYPVALEHVTAMRERLTCLKIIDVNDKEGALAVHKGRMECVKTRGAIEAKRKELKADSLEYGRRVDSVAKILTDGIKEIETDLAAKEKVIEDEKERLAKEKADAVWQDRYDRMVEAGVQDDPRLSESKVRDMVDDFFDSALKIASADRAAKLKREEEARQAEEERKRLLAEEHERQRVERERLEAERKQLEEERREQQRKLDEERAEFERQRKADDERREREREEHERQRAERDRLESERQQAERDRLAEDRRALEAKQKEINERRERMEAEERERLENARLERERVEREERERQEELQRIERERIEAEERIERERLEKEQEAERQRIQELREEQLRPEREKLEKFATKIEATKLPDVSQSARMELAEIIDRAADSIRNLARSLS